MWTDYNDSTAFLESLKSEHSEVRRGPPPNVVTYNSVISACGKVLSSINRKLSCWSCIREKQSCMLFVLLLEHIGTFLSPRWQKQSYKTMRELFLSKNIKRWGNALSDRLIFWVCPGPTVAARRGSVGRSPRNETSAQTSVIASAEEGQSGKTFIPGQLHPNVYIIHR